MADKDLDWESEYDPAANEPGYDAALEARLDAEAEADVVAGRVVSHERVVEWLLSWGTDHELPCPEPDAPKRKT